MGKPLRALIVEDNEKDAELLLLELKRSGYDVSFECVETENAMRDALEREKWDIVFSDFTMPHFNGLSAFALYREMGMDMPFFIVSGTIGEDSAVLAMKAGVHDYFVKGNLKRLIPAVERELREVSIRVEKRKMQDQLIISDRMASIGTLAAGVAHEINNPLMALMGNIEFAGRDLKELNDAVNACLSGDKAHVESSRDLIQTQLDKIEKSIEHAREVSDRIRLIVRDLKIFSRSDEETTGPVNIHYVLDSSARMAWNEIRHRARLVKDYGNVSLAEGNEARLGQVFLNLIVNAAQAIKEGDTENNEIRITTRTDESGKVIVEIKDTGCGIPKGIQGHIFDPFFTTKPIGVGTGIGLAICHRIIAFMGGEISFESDSGKGTVFRVVLPPYRTDLLKPAPPPMPATGQNVRKGKILVIDDETLVGEVIRNMLSQQHDVTLVNSSLMAIEKIKTGEEYDVILCDLMMPQITGMDLYEELKRIAPAYAEKMAFMTGGAFTHSAREFLNQIPNAWIEKPFDQDQILNFVNNLLR